MKQHLLVKGFLLPTLSTLILFICFSIHLVCVSNYVYNTEKFKHLHCREITSLPQIKKVIYCSCHFNHHQKLTACLLRIQVECLMTSVIAFVITVDWLRCKANCQALLGWDDIILSGKKRVILSICMSW